jgi:hypothetical protein
LIFKLNLICRGWLGWPKFFEPGTSSKSSEIHSFSSLLGHYLEKNKILVYDFLSIDRGQIDLENDIQ